MSQVLCHTMTTFWKSRRMLMDRSKPDVYGISRHPRQLAICKAPSRSVSSAQAGVYTSSTLTIPLWQELLLSQEGSIKLLRIWREQVWNSQLLEGNISDFLAIQIVYGISILCPSWHPRQLVYAKHHCQVGLLQGQGSIKSLTIWREQVWNSQLKATLVTF